jgi:hypothetical protein
MGLLLQPSSHDTTAIEMADHNRSLLPVGIPSQEFATSISSDEFCLVDLLIDAEPDGDENAAKRSTLHFFLEEQIGHLRCLVDDLQRTSHSLIPQGLEVQP